MSKTTKKVCSIDIKRPDSGKLKIAAASGHTRCSLAGVAILIVMGGTSAAGAQGVTGPELRLFSSTIVEDIRRTGEAAETMESGVLEGIEHMDQQLALYKASNCESASDDSGCSEMRRQLGQSYGTMLDAMEEALPEMQSAITRSRDGLQGSLVAQIGRGLSPTGLQHLMLDEEGPEQSSAAARPERAGSSRLSQRFQQYYTLVAGAQGGIRGGRGALAVTAADIYLDMQEAAELIQLTSDEIARSQIMIDLDQAMPGMTEQMELTVDGVKRVLFGEEEGLADPTMQLPPVVASSEDAPTGVFASPLEF